MATIKQMKSVFYKVESTFGEAYNVAAAGSGFQEIAVSDLEISKLPEDLTTLYMNKTRVLDEDHSSGRTNGSFTFKKNIDTSLMGNHQDLISTALGTVVPFSVSSAVTGHSITTNQITFDMSDTSDFAVGDLVQFVATDGTKYAINRVESIVDDTSITMEMLICTDEQTKLAGVTTGTLHKVSYIRPSVPDMSKTFQFVVVFQDDSIEVFRGASAKASFSITNEGKGEIDFEVQAAEVQDLDYNTKLPLALITDYANVVPEDAGLPVIYNFQTSQLLDPVLVSDFTLFPYQLNIEFGNTIEPIKKTGCLNNISGWYIKPSISGTSSWERSSTTMVIFSKYYENVSGQFFFTSNADFAFYAQKCKYTNLDAKSVDSYDSMDTRMNVNSWVSSDSEPLLVLPQVYA